MDSKWTTNGELVAQTAKQVVLTFQNNNTTLDSEKAELISLIFITGIFV